MTINLVQHMGPEQAHQLLEQSFAQYQADRSVVGLVRGIERGKRMLDEIAAELGGADAPILEYARMRARISEMEKAQSRASRLHRRQAASEALAGLRRGDIITITQGRHGGLAVVLESARDGDDPRPLVLTEHRWAGRISSADYSGASAPVGSMSLPKRVEHRQPRVRRDLASALRSAAAGLVLPSTPPRAAAARMTGFHDPELASLRTQLRQHPAHNSPGVESTRSARPSAICASNATMRSWRRRSPPPPTRWPARSTGSSGCSPSGSSSGACRRSASHRRRAVVGPHLQRERSAGRRMPAQRRVGGV